MKTLHKLINTEVRKALNENKTKMIVKRLKEDTDYRMFFNKAMDKFKINSPADLKDPAKKKQFFDYIDTNYKSKSEMNEGTYLMSNPATKAKVDKIIELLIGIDIDGETMQYILEAVGMDEQMASQLGDRVDDDGFPSMSGGRP